MKNVEMNDDGDKRLDEKFIYSKQMKCGKTEMIKVQETFSHYKRLFKVLITNNKGNISRYS